MRSPAVSVILKVGVLLEALDDVLSVQLRARFVFDAGLVAAGMVASIVCALVLAAFLAIAQLLAALGLRGLVHPAFLFTSSSWL